MRELLPDCRFLVRAAVVGIVLVAGAGAAQAANYWFETYESAVELIQDDRHTEAQELLADVLEDHPVPQSGVRVPGNRYITYVPYLQRAQIQFQQGDYALASKSLDVSEAFGAVTRDRRHMTELRELRQKLQAKQVGGEFVTEPPVALKVERPTD